MSIRFDQIGAAIHVWHLSPILGEGMRFYNLPQFISVTAPPNVLVDNLASTGIVGSLAFFFLVFVTMRTMSALPYPFGTLGLVILLGHYVDGLFDIFWIGAPSIAPVHHRRDLAGHGRCSAESGGSLVDHGGATPGGDRFRPRPEPGTGDRSAHWPTHWQPACEPWGHPVWGRCQHRTSGDHPHPPHRLQRPAPRTAGRGSQHLHP